MPLKTITIESVDRFTALVIGPAGIGKTSLLRTIPKNEKAIILSAESGLLCVRDLVKSGQVEGFEIGSFQEMTEAYNYLVNPDIAKKYQWIFIDSLTEISGRCVEAMKAKYPAGGDSFKLWGDYADRMTALVKGFRDISGYSVVFTCLPTVDKDEANRRFVAPAVAGTSLKERLTSYFDEVLYMSMQKADDGTEYRAFVTQSFEKYPAKDRSGKLSLIEKPDLAYLKTKIMTGHGKKEGK